jgi:hypothetical protein
MNPDCDPDIDSNLDFNDIYYWRRGQLEIHKGDITPSKEAAITNMLKGIDYVGIAVSKDNKVQISGGRLDTEMAASIKKILLEK